MGCELRYEGEGGDADKGAQREDQGGGLLLRRAAAFLVRGRQAGEDLVDGGQAAAIYFKAAQQLGAVLLVFADCHQSSLLRRQAHPHLGPHHQEVHPDLPGAHRSHPPGQVPLARQLHRLLLP